MDQLDIHPRIITAVKKSNLNKVETILSLSCPEIERRTRLSANDVSLLKTAVAKLVPRLPHTTALDIYQGVGPAELDIRKLSLGCSILDSFLRGGVFSCGITEICGVSSSGKTQICLQLCLTVQLPVNQGGLHGGAVYICTEDVFPTKRLFQMIEHFKRKLCSSLNFGDNILIEHVADVAGLMFLLNKRMPVLLSQNKVKLLIIDSVAALFRSEFGAGEMYKRAKQLGSLGVLLSELGARANIPVVCVNQVTDNVSENNDNSSAATNKRKVLPSLGLTWSNQITTRIMLHRTNSTSPAPSDDNQDVVNACCSDHVIRTMEVMFAPHLPAWTCQYVVEHGGVKGVR